MKKLFLAECSNSYRIWLKQFWGHYFDEVVDLWENPAALMQTQNPETLQNMLLVDEDFLHKGPGPAREQLRDLLQPNRISALSIVLLERRQKMQMNQYSERVHKLRRPFHSSELTQLISNLQLEFTTRSPAMIETPIFNADFEAEEQNKNEELQNQNTTPLDSELVLQTFRQFLQSDEFKKNIEDGLQKAIQNIVPDIAERLIQDEIKRLTE